MNKTNPTKLFLALSALIVVTATIFIGCKKNVDAVVNAPSEYINYTVNGIPYSFVPPVDSILSIPGGLTFVLRVNGNRIPVNTNYVTVVFDYVAISAGTRQHLMAFNVALCEEGGKT